MEEKLKAIIEAHIKDLKKDFAERSEADFEEQKPFTDADIRLCAYEDVVENVKYIMSDVAYL